MSRTAPPLDKSRAKIKWSQDDTIALLANLDFVVIRIREQSGWTNKKEVLQQLRPRLKKRRTVRQIEGKLNSLNGSAGPKALADVYRYGSSRLQQLDFGLKVKVQEVLQIIKSKEVCLVVSTPRQLRSASHHLGFEANRPRRESTICGERTPTRSMSRTQQRAPKNLISKVGVGENESQSSKQNLLNHDTITISRPVSTSRPTKTPSYRCTTSTEEVIKSSQSSDTCMEGSSHEFYSLNETPTPRIVLQPSLYELAINGNSAIDYEDPNTIQQVPQTPILDLACETLRDLFSDNVYFRRKWAESEEKCQRIEQNERLKHSLLASGSPDIAVTMAGTIEMQNEKINNLQYQLSNQRFLERFLKLGKVDEVPLNKAQIQTNNKKMRREFKSLSIMDCFHHPATTSIYNEPRDLAELKSLVPGNLHGYPVGLVVQSLTGAAICEWVFNGKIQCAAMMGTPLLEAYRHQLGAVCDELTLRNVDLAAHQWVINKDTHFHEKFLPRTAAQLSGRLLNALVPFIKHRGDSEDALRVRLESIFCAALKIKTSAMMGNNVFECTWPAHNSSFDRSSMEEDSTKVTVSKQVFSKHGAKRVMLALVPGLNVYNSTRKLVDYCGFTKGAEEGLKQPSLVAQAVVVVQQ